MAHWAQPDSTRLDSTKFNWIQLNWTRLDSTLPLYFTSWYAFLNSIQPFPTSNDFFVQPSKRFLALSFKSLWPFSHKLIKIDSKRNGSLVWFRSDLEVYVWFGIIQMSRNGSFSFSSSLVVEQQEVDQIKQANKQAGEQMNSSPWAPLYCDEEYPLFSLSIRALDIN